MHVSLLAAFAQINREQPTQAISVATQLWYRGYRPSAGVCFRVFFFLLSFFLLFLFWIMLLLILVFHLFALWVCCCLLYALTLGEAVSVRQVTALLPPIATICSCRIVAYRNQGYPGAMQERLPTKVNWVDRLRDCQERISNYCSLNKRFKLPPQLALTLPSWPWPLPCSIDWPALSSLHNTNDDQFHPRNAVWMARQPYHPSLSIALFWYRTHIRSRSTEN